MARVTKLEALCCLMLASATAAATAAQLSTPIIMSAETPPAKATVSEQKAPPEQKTPPVPATAYTPPVSLSPQRQVQSHQAPPSPPMTANEIIPSSSMRSQEKPVANREVGSASASVHHQSKAVRIDQKRLQLRRKREGGAIYRISFTQPRSEITLFNGQCYAENKFEMRQQLLDMGLDTKKTSRLHPVYASLQTGRVAGCWYFDPSGKFFRVALENGQGEDFAKEQVDKIRR